MFAMVQELMNQWWIKAKTNNYSNYVLGGLLVVGIAVGGWKGLEWYRIKRNQKAQLAFSDALDEYQRSLYYVLAKPDEREKIEDHLKDAALAFSTVVEQHAHSALAPYAKAFLAEIHLLKKEMDEALALFNTVIDQVGAHSPLYYLYQTKRALVLLALGRDAEGVAELEKLASADANKQSDDAAYFLGEYFWSKGEFQKAAHAWERFTEDKQPKNPVNVSPWVQVVQPKLKQIA